MAHGTPLATGEADHECGAAGPFLLEVGISSSYHIAKFFGLTAASNAFADGESDMTAIDLAAARQSQKRTPEPALPRVHVLDGEVLGPDDAAEPDDMRSDRGPFQSPQFDVGAVINKALKAAGLMK